MFALPTKANYTTDMLKDLQRASRPGMKNLDVNQYMLSKYGRGLYQISPASPGRPPIRIRGRTSIMGTAATRA
jgi:hypothetical protein